MPVNGLAVAVTGTGALFLYSAIRGVSVLASLQSVVQGKSPAANPQTQPIAETVGGTIGDTAITVGNELSTGLPGAGTGGIAGSYGGGSAKSALMAAAAVRGWGSGAQWAALDAIEMQEAGYDPTNTNPSSRAYGMAQSLGHGFPGGPASNGINEYGGEGLSAAESRAASMGDPVPQSKWMVNYIASRYGNPVVAEQFHLAHNWY